MVMPLLEQVTQALPSHHLPETLGCQPRHVFSLNYYQKRHHGNARQPAHQHLCKKPLQIMMVFNNFHQKNVKTRVSDLLSLCKGESGIYRPRSHGQSVGQVRCLGGQAATKLPPPLLHLQGALSTALGSISFVLSFFLSS